MFLWRRVAPQSPEAALAPTAAPGYTRNFRDLNRLISRGKSFSGYERNALFLNLHGRRFADAAGLLGVDFDDDARAVARVDWDRDGDADLWVTNRTAPRVRLLMNNLPPTTASLQVRLIGNGTTTNRDAIGARLTLWSSDQPQDRQIRGVRAGDGFLSQSSAWTHFGMGSASGPCTLAIDWPGGSRETFTGLAPGGRYIVTQGGGMAAESRLPPVTIPAAAQSEPASGPETAGFWLARRLPFPNLAYTADDGATRSTADQGSAPTLINLWATWCAPCRAELKEWATHADRISRLGASVLALNVDGLAVEASAAPTAPPADVLSQLGYRLGHGAASAQTVEKLEILIEFLTSRRGPIPIPTSFLVDRGGRLAAIYTGPVGIDRLTADLALLTAPPEAEMARLSPRPGRWLADPRLIDRAAYTNDLAVHFASHGFPDEAQRLYSMALPQGGAGRAPDLFNQAKSAAAQGDSAKAIELYQAALRLDPEYGEALTGLGAMYLIKRRPAEARPYFEKALALDPNHATALINLALIDRQEGHPDRALARLQQVLEHNPDFAEAHLNLGSLLASLGREKEGVQHLERALASKPSLRSAAILTAIGRAHHATGNLTAARAAYIQALEIDPAHPRARQALESLGAPPPQ